MPHSPFTRCLAFSIVAAYALALLWPDPYAHVMGWHAMVALPVVLGLFTWSAVRDAPPFDDLAFHRTLPPGDGHAFRRTLAIHGMILLGIALAVIVYCRIFNFGWESVSYGVVVLTLPVWGFMAACGVACSLSTSRQYGKSWGYIAIFVVPVFSATLLFGLRQHFDPEIAHRRAYYFNALRAMALAGAVLYPLIWWLVAVKRRRVLGAALGAATGALMPWIYIYGSFFEKTEPGDPLVYQNSPVTISRKPFVPGEEDKWLSVGDLLDVRGLGRGEYLTLQGIRVGEKRGYLQTYGVPEVPASAEGEIFWTGSTAMRLGDGSIGWSERAFWNELRGQIPAHETFAFWDRELEASPRTAVLRPGESALVGPRKDQTPFKPNVHQQHLTENDFTTTPWSASWAEVFRLEKQGDYSAARGGGCRLPEGGILRISPLQQKDNRTFITIRYHFQDLWQADGPWFEPDAGGFYWGQKPRVIAIDESGKHAFALPSSNYRSVVREVMLGHYIEWKIDIGETTLAADKPRIETMRHSRLHLFWPRALGAFKQEMPPPR